MKIDTFWSLLPINYFVGEYDKADARVIELDVEFRVLFIKTIGVDYLKGSMTLSRDEQNILDAEIDAMQFGFEGSTVRHLIQLELNRSQLYIEKTLDKIEAKFYFRDLINAELPPPRTYNNICSGYWQSFFDMQF